MAGSRRRERGSIPTEVRNSVMFVVALGLLIYEAVIRSASAEPRPWLIGAYLLMLGFPVVDIADSFRNRLIETSRRKDGSDQGDPEGDP